MDTNDSLVQLADLLLAKLQTHINGMGADLQALSLLCMGTGNMEPLTRFAGIFERSANDTRTIVKAMELAIAAESVAIPT